MANEVLPSNRGVIYAKTETTYATDPTLAAANVQYVEEYEAEAKPILEQRTGVSPFRGGFKPRRVGQENSGAFRVEMISEEIAGTDIVTPPIEPFLMACGFGKLTVGGATAGFTAGTPNTLDYTLLSHGHGSCAIEERFFVPSLADGIGRQYLGYRADWTITIDGQGIWWLAPAGNSKTGTSITTPAFVAATDYPFSSTGLNEGPAIGSATTVTITSLDTDGIYGGATLDAVVSSATITGNMNLQVVPGLAGSVGPAKVILNPQMGIGVELLMEQVVDSDWDPFGWMIEGGSHANSLTCRILYDGGKGTLALTSTDDVGIYMAMSELSIVSEDAGRRLWRINHTGIYPEISSDLGGLRPANNFMLRYANT